MYLQLSVCRWKNLHMHLAGGFLLLVWCIHTLEFILTEVYHIAEEIMLHAVSFSKNIWFVRYHPPVMDYRALGLHPEIQILHLFKNKTSGAAEQNWFCFSAALCCLPPRGGGLGSWLGLAAWGGGGQTAPCSGAVGPDWCPQRGPTYSSRSSGPPAALQRSWCHTGCWFE